MILQFKSIVKFGRRSYRSGPAQSVNVPDSTPQAAFAAFVAATFAGSASEMTEPQAWYKGGAPDPYAPPMPPAVAGTITAPCTMDAGELGVFHVWAAE